jgi:oligopeptide transport system substrate-binding protein
VTVFEPGNLSPGIAMDHPSAVIQDQLFSGLVEVGPDMSILPDVAHSWDVLDGGRKYVFHLREDVYWSDGIQVTANDYEYSLIRALDPKRGWPAVELLYDIKGAVAYHQGTETNLSQVGVRALDHNTLVIELEGPTNYFLYLLAYSPMYPVPRHVESKHGINWINLENIVTNGPFFLSDYRSGELIKLQRNQNYHGRFSGNLEKVECTILSKQPRKYIQMYDEDLLDICDGLPPVDISLTRQRYAGEYVTGPSLSINFIGFDLDRSPFADPRVRRAFTQATDRETLAHVALRGFAFPATGGLTPPGLSGHSPDIGLPYNPENARKMMREAGYPNGKNFPVLDCIARDDPGHDLICDYLGALWLENIGVEINWRPVTWSQFPKIMSTNIPHLWLVGWWADYPDPDDFLRIQWWMPPSWNNQSFKQLVESARRVTDQNERVSIYQEADRTLIEDAPVLPLCYARQHFLVKPWVRNYNTSPLKWWIWKDVIIEPHEK